MSQSVDRLKELLFDTEARALSDVQQRLTKSESDLLSHRREFADRLDRSSHEPEPKNAFASLSPRCSTALCAMPRPSATPNCQPPSRR